MNTRTKVLLLVLLTGGLSLGGLYAQAQKKPAIAFPVGFRKWTHIKSVVIFSKENKLFDRFGGLHNIYVNDIGWPALKVGLAFPDGSMFAFELCDTRTYQGAIESKGRKLLAVMKKNAKLYPETGGWGFEVFQGYQGTGSLKDMKECWSCHSAQKRRNYVFSEYGE